MKKWIISFILGTFFFFSLLGCEKTNIDVQMDREEVLMRKIGHEILLQSHDTTSLILPIIKNGDKYRIKFGSDFDFFPENIVLAIDSIFKNSDFNKSYIVQVEACENQEIVYSYEVDVFSAIPFPDDIACKERPQPEGCYEVIIQFIRTKQPSTYNWLYILLLIPTLLTLLYFYKKKTSLLDKDKIKIGEYLYDAKKMILIRQEKTIELTSKENELLSLLYEFANKTVTKETILNKVWGDEGDYVGRTLDVYISKLRKKLESDASIQLKNIRGIGYKLILED